MLVDKVIQEWSFKTKKGYPDINSKEDMDLFESIFGFRLDEDEEKTQDSLLERFKQRISSLPGKISKIALDIYSNLDPKRKKEIDKHLGQYSIEEFEKNLKQLADIFSPFFYTGKEGTGNGELLPLLAIKDSKSGGTGDKDIKIKGKILEVKELDASNRFRTGKTGSIRDSKLDANVQTLIKLLKNLDDIPEIAEQREELLKYYDTTYKFGTGKPDYFVKDIVNIVKKLREMNLDSEDYVKMGGKRYTYTRKDINTIILGPEMKERAVTLSKLKRHPYYINSEELINNFKEARDTFLNSIHYLLLYPKGVHTPIGLFSTEEAKDRVHAYDVNGQRIRLRYGNKPRITL